MTQSRTLADFLKKASINVTPSTPAAAPVVAAPAKVAAVTAPAAPAAPAKVAAPVAPAAPVMYDPNVIKTAEQKWLLNEGILIPDEKKAAALCASMRAEQEAIKKAELNKFAAEKEAEGVLLFHGQLKEATAMRVAEGEASRLEVIKTAAWVGCDVSEILARASELKKIAELAAASEGAAFFGNERGRAARTNDSEVLGAAEKNQNTTHFEPEAVAGTRAAVRGSDAADLRFQETVTIPNNPGLNHGQKTDNGKSA